MSDYADSLRTSSSTALRRLAPGLIVSLSLLGVGISAYLSYTALSGQALVCIGGGGCQTVQLSPYSRIAGIPQGVFGLVAYLALTILSIAALRLCPEQPLRPLLYLGVFSLSLIGVFYSLYLTYLEVFVIHAICSWCVASAVVVTGILLLSLPLLHA